MLKLLRLNANGAGEYGNRAILKMFGFALIASLPDLTSREKRIIDGINKISN